jgi:hypothetical protein
MTNKITYSYKSMGYPELLTIFFIGLKLTGYITWSWWWVFSPLWIISLLSISIIAIIVLFVWFDKAMNFLDD